MTRKALLLATALGLAVAAPALAQDLADRPVTPPPVDNAPPGPAEELRFSADTMEYDDRSDTVTVTGDVRLTREGNRLRADRVVWNRRTGEVVATGNIAVTNPAGDTAYGDRIELTDSLKDGVVENMLVVLEGGGRIAARRGTRNQDGVVTVDSAAYTPCPVTDTEGCPREPSWKITAVSVVYDPKLGRVRYRGARLSLFGVASVPLPNFSHPAGDRSDDGFLTPDIRYGRVNGLEFAIPYYFSIAPNRDLTLTPRIFSNALPMLQAEYRQLGQRGAFRVTGYATYSRQSDDQLAGVAGGTANNEFRGYFDGVANYQFGPNWSAGASLRIASDRTFLRRYDISRDDRLRNNLRVERVDADSYFALNGWAVQTLRTGDRQGLQPIALPELDYRLRFGDGVIGGRFTLQVNTLAIGRSSGQDTQRAFASLRWDLRALTALGHEIQLTAFGRGDLYNTTDTLLTTVASYRGNPGFTARGIGAAAIDIKWPFIGPAFGGTQRITPRIQFVASPRIANLAVPNEDSRAFDLEESNLFALNRYPGYDRFDDSTRITWGVDYALNIPNVAINATFGQSYRISNRPTLFPDGTGLSERVSDFVGRTEVRYRDFLTFTHRYRLDKDSLAIRRNEIDATIGSRSTYAVIGYLRLDRNIGPALEDLQDREEIRVGGRIQIARYWSVFGSAVIDLTDRNETLTARTNGFEPVRHRIGFAYDDDCLKLGLTWKRDYGDTGDARSGSSFLLTLAFRNLGR